MDLVDWEKLPPGITKIWEAIHEGRASILHAVHGYQSPPYCFTPTQVFPPSKVLSKGGKFLLIFETPQPLVARNEDEAALFKSVVECLRFLDHKRLALETVDDKTFCRGEGRQICMLSPRCQIVNDHDGSQLLDNIQSISDLKLFHRMRFLHAFKTSKNFANFLKHPAMWSPLEDFSFIFYLNTFIGDFDLTLDHLLKLGAWNQEESIKQDLAALKNKAKNLIPHKFKSMLRYARNKMAHFDECSDELAMLFNHSPEGVIDYFNRKVVIGGDLVFAVWEFINQKHPPLIRFWIEYHDGYRSL